MTWNFALSIALRSLVALVLFGAAAYAGYLIERRAVRRGWNGRLWRYLSYRHHVVPRSAEERRNWHGVFWCLFAFLALMVVLWYTDPVGHTQSVTERASAGADVSVPQLAPNAHRGRGVWKPAETPFLPTD